MLTVNTRIEEGWLPLGGVAMRYSVWEGNVYVQSLISIEEEDEDYNADDEMDTEETSLQSEEIDEEDEDQNSQENEDEEEADDADQTDNDNRVEEDANVALVEDLTPEVQHQSPVQLSSTVEHTAFCRKYNYVDCNCDETGGFKRARNLTLTDSDDERVSSGIDIQAASYRYN